MTYLYPLAAALPEKPTMSESLQYGMVGLIVVFTALCSIWALLELMGVVFRSLERRRKAREEAAMVAAIRDNDTTSVDDNIAPETVAVISAAVYACLEAGAHIVSIMPVDRAAPARDLQLMAWSSEGRRQIFASHKIR